MLIEGFSRAACLNYHIVDECLMLLNVLQNWPCAQENQAFG